jgi:hypothetical protein
MYDIYVIDFSLLWEKLYPPILRQSLHLAWGAVVVKPLQRLRSLALEDYANGSIATRYDNSTAYSVGDEVYYTNRAVYKCIGASTGNLPTDTTYWTRILDNRIGVRERIKYDSRKVLFEYALNRWFDVPSADPQIYITNNDIYGTAFLLGESGETSSTMAWNSNFQNFYLGNSYSYESDAFTIYVPLLVFNALDTNNTNRENIIRGFADNYVLSGITYNVLTY